MNILSWITLPTCFSKLPFGRYLEVCQQLRFLGHHWLPLKCKGAPELFVFPNSSKIFSFVDKNRTKNYRLILSTIIVNYPTNLNCAHIPLRFVCIEITLKWTCLPETIFICEEVFSFALKCHNYLKMYSFTHTLYINTFSCENALPVLHY